MIPYWYFVHDLATELITVHSISVGSLANPHWIPLSGLVNIITSTHEPTHWKPPTFKRILPGNAVK
jgi:hypothetical protein